MARDWEANRNVNPVGLWQRQEQREDSSWEDFTHLAKTYLGAAWCGYCVYASSGDAAVLACSESVIGIVGIIVGGGA